MKAQAGKTGKGPGGTPAKRKGMTPLEVIRKVPKKAAKRLADNNKPKKK